ncbi:MAG: peptidylprolyl isomerase [Deltaproteobacteria bacterium]|nr:peptidylprolyl isomerase [Myxococcales bacterium]MDP3216138.1 peptidylprolyl isomerase [Deltaproteobacteria bacterium]
MLGEATQADGQPAAFALGRRAPLGELTAIAGTLPSNRLDAFLRGMTRRPLGAITLPTSWRLRWTQSPPSVALAMLIGENPIPLDPPLAGYTETLLLDGDLRHQLAGARSLQNPNVTLPSGAALAALHPVVFPLAMRSLSLHGGVSTSVWLNLIATIGARVHPNPRSWSGAWISLMDAAPTTDPAVRGALLALEPVVTQVELQPTSVLAAYRCAIALRFDRIDQGQRTETCATGNDAWRSLSTLAARARPPLAPAILAEQLRNILVRGSSDPRVVEPVAQATVLLPVANARPLLLQLVENRDPGVLAALLEALNDHLPHARSLPPPVLDRLLQSPFDLPEASSLDARLHAIALRRALQLPAVDVPTTVRALRQAAQPDAGVSPQSALVAPPTMAGTWVIQTTAGNIRVALRADTAPEALRTLLDATQSGLYRSTTFHRVVPGFVAQGGDPRGDGYGGTTRIVPTELSGARFERGAVGIALAGLDTGGAGFFITLTDSPFLDARYPYVGQVVSGMEVADRLMTGDEIVSVGVAPPGDAPSEP